MRNEKIRNKFRATFGNDEKTLLVKQASDNHKQPNDFTVTFKIDKVAMLIKQIFDAYKQAMLDNNEDKKRVISTLRAEIKNKEIELRASNKELTDTDILSLIQKLIKQNKDAIEMFKQGNRQDLVEQNELEISILQGFLPKQLTNEEIDNTIKQEIEDNNYNSMKDMGKIIATFKNNYSGQCDIGYVSKRIKEMLQQ